MSNNSISNQINKEICNAFGCPENATEKVDVNVGDLGTISLNLCKDCVKKFV